MEIIDKQSFWQWAYSDFLSNAQRGVLAEYIVAKAVNATDKPRKEWDAYDVVTPSGIKIEVKSSAYLQTWKQAKPSVIRFDIANKKAWDAETNFSSPDSMRPADIYVFCLYAEENYKNAEGPLNIDKWEFLVCTTKFLDEKFQNQKSIALSSLENSGLVRVTYDKLGHVIGRIQTGHI